MVSRFLTEEKNKTNQLIYDVATLIPIFLDAEDEPPNTHMATEEEDTLKRWQLINAAITNDAQVHHRKDRDGDPRGRL